MILLLNISGLYQKSFSKTPSNSPLNFYFRKLREVYDSYGGHMKLSNVPEAYKILTNRTLEPTKSYKKLQNNSNSNPSITYQEFCLLVADNFTTDGYDIYMADGRAYFSDYFWPCTFLKTQYFIRTFIVDPLFNALGSCMR